MPFSSLFTHQFTDAISPTDRNPMIYTWMDPSPLTARYARMMSMITKMTLMAGTYAAQHDISSKRVGGREQNNASFTTRSKDI